MFNHTLSSCFKKANNGLYIFILAFSLLLFLSGCKRTSAQLQALESSASIIQLRTGREVSRWSQDTEAGFTGPVYAEIRIKYEPINNYTKEEVYNEIVDVLEKNNWERDEWNIDRSDYFSASLQQDHFTLLAIVRIHSDENFVSIRIVNRKP